MPDQALLALVGRVFLVGSSARFVRALGEVPQRAGRM
jgi:hypothetical protein